MNRRLWVLAACFSVLWFTAASPEPGFALFKDQSRIGEEDPDVESWDLPTPETEFDETVPPDTPELDELPPVETVELTVDSAKRALDAFADVRDKYNDQGIEDYATLQEFVDRTEAGKRLEAEIKAHGFTDVMDWNRTVTSVAFAYSAVFNGQEPGLRQQIEAVRDDPSLDEPTRSQIIADLTGLLPSENNKKVLRQLLDDPIYRERLKLLDEVE